MPPDVEYQATTPKRKEVKKQSPTNVFSMDQDVSS